MSSAAIIGSGTVPLTVSILSTANRGIGDPAGGQFTGTRYGTQVIVANPEDFNSVSAFGVVDIDVGTSAVEILAPGTNPLPRQGFVRITNTGTNTVFIGPSSSVSATTGYPIRQNTEIVLPMMHNVAIFGITTSGTSDVRLLVY